jgi:hypothetical protein
MGDMVLPARAFRSRPRISTEPRASFATQNVAEQVANVFEERNSLIHRKLALEFSQSGPALLL